MTELLLTNSRHCFWAVNVWPCPCLPLGSSCFFFFFLGDSFLHFFLSLLSLLRSSVAAPLVRSLAWGRFVSGCLSVRCGTESSLALYFGLSRGGLRERFPLGRLHADYNNRETRVSFSSVLFFSFTLFCFRSPGNDERGVPFSQFGASSELDRLAANASLPVGMSPQSTW